MARARRRTFSTGERVALWLVADGYCEMCGVELEPGWHADHVEAFSRGGETDVTNGAALCPPCNWKKGAGEVDQRSVWQQDQINRITKSDKDWLVSACPGAGKTRLALGVARRHLDLGDINFVIVVVPRSHLKEQWTQVAHEHFDMSLMPDFTNSSAVPPPDFDGMVVTYQQVKFNPFLFRTISYKRGPTMVVFDEIHHCSDDEGGSWGPAIKEAFELSTRRLLLSGTPFRSDGQPIPFVKYDNFGYSKSDTTLSYGQAVTMGFVRAVRFEMLDGEARWLKGGERWAMVAEATEAERFDALNTIYDPDGNWIESVFSRADSDLSIVREDKPNAAGLIVAHTKDKARKYADLMHRISGERPALVYDDISDASNIIERFRNGTGRWIVAVDMVSEGVDIPRLVSVVWASHKRTELWFRQIVGRAVRSDDDDVTATIYLPARDEWRDLAQRIEKEADVALSERAEAAEREREAEEEAWEFEISQPLTSSSAILTNVIARSEAYDQDQLEMVERLKAEVGGSLQSVNPEDIIKLLQVANTDLPQARVEKIKQPATSVTMARERTAKRALITNLVNKVAAREDMDPKRLNVTLIKMWDVKRDQATIQVLDEQIQWLRDRLNN